MKNYLILFVLLFGCAGSSVERHETQNTTKHVEVEETIIEPVDEPIPIVKPEVNTHGVSKVIELKINYGKMPSYCKPESYKIAKMPNGQYKIQYSGGTLSTQYFNTVEETQEEINSRAAASYKTWIDSGGHDY